MFWVGKFGCSLKCTKLTVASHDVKPSNILVFAVSRQMLEFLEIWEQSLIFFFMFFFLNIVSWMVYVTSFFANQYSDTMAFLLEQSSCNKRKYIDVW